MNNRLANALGFAVVVIALLIMEVRASHPQYAPANLVAKAICVYRAAESRMQVAPAPPALVSPELPELPVVMAQARFAQRELARAQVRRAMESLRVQTQRGPVTCKVVKIDQ